MTSIFIYYMVFNTDNVLKKFFFLVLVFTSFLLSFALSAIYLLVSWVDWIGLEIYTHDYLLLFFNNFFFLSIEGLSSYSSNRL